MCLSGLHDSFLLRPLYNPPSAAGCMRQHTITCVSGSCTWRTLPGSACSGPTLLLTAAAGATPSAAPCRRLQPFLEPYLDPGRRPSLIEVVLYKKRQVELRFSDGNSQHLGLKSNMPQALALLAAAKEQWQQDDSDSCTDEQGDDDYSQPDYDGPFSSFGSLSSAAAAAAAGPFSSLRPRGISTGSAAAAAAAALGDLFRSDERLGVPSTLHRIAAMRNMSREVIGLTYRIGRAVPGVGLLLGDVLSAMRASLESNR